MAAAHLLLKPIGYDIHGNEIVSPEMKRLNEEYQIKVIDPCDDLDNACFKANFIKFINTFTLSNGQTLGILYFEATLNSDQTVSNWTQND
jgi:hypothetical protein